MNVIEVDRLQASYGRALTLHDISFSVRAHEAVALLGRNGMGKTSTLRCVMRFREPHLTGGTILLEETDIRALRSFELAKRGVGYVPQGRRVFRSLTVAENLQIVHRGRRRSDVPRWSVERVFKLFPQLGLRKGSLAGRLSGGEQQMLAIGRALMSNPVVLLLDEPSEGLAPAVVDDVIAALKDIHESGVAIVLAEQDISLAAEVCERFVIVDSGESVMDVDRGSFVTDDHLQAALLGLGSAGPEPKRNEGDA